MKFNQFFFLLFSDTDYFDVCSDSGMKTSEKCLVHVQKKFYIKHRFKITENLQLNWVSFLIVKFEE